MKKCKHSYKPIEFVKCVPDREELRTLYVYQMQCMKCGKKYRLGFYPIFMGFKEMQELHYPFELQKKTTKLNFKKGC